jgi:hypothetical protein
MCANAAYRILQRSNSCMHALLITVLIARNSSACKIASTFICIGTAMYIQLYSTYDASNNGQAVWQVHSIAAGVKAHAYTELR